MCEYCGIRESQTTIINPKAINDDKEHLTWQVCLTCKKIIQQKQKQAFGIVLEHYSNMSKEELYNYAISLQEDAKKKIEELKLGELKK